MKKILLLIGLIAVLGTEAYSQQDPQYSQYMFNGLMINPAYAGSREVLSMAALTRIQWVGINGAPRTTTFSIHGPLRSEKNALGASLYYDELGITQQVAFNAVYAYRIQLNNSTLSMGLQGGFMNHSNRWSEAVTTDPDGGTPMQNQSAYLPMVGTGAYLYSQRYYVGVGVPNFIPNKYENPNSVATSVAARQQAHVFGTAGLVIPIGQNVEFKPSTVVKYVRNAPVEFDFNASFLLHEALWLGTSYRTGDAIVFLAQYIFNNQLRIGYAYDYTITRLGNYNSGSHEIMVGLELGWNKSRIKTPRYF